MTDMNGNESKYFSAMDLFIKWLDYRFIMSFWFVFFINQIKVFNIFFSIIWFLIFYLLLYFIFLLCCKQILKQPSQEISNHLVKDLVYLWLGGKILIGLITSMLILNIILSSLGYIETAQKIPIKISMMEGKFNFKLGSYDSITDKEKEFYLRQQSNKGNEK